MLRKLTLLLVLVFSFTGIFSQSISPAWVNRYAGAGDNSDSYNKLIPDGSGNFIAVGYTIRNNNYRDFLTVKLNSSLDTVWTRTKNGTNSGNDEALDAAVDASGNIYVTGYTDNGNTGNDILTIKYAADGTDLWDTAYNTPDSAFLDDAPTDIAVDASGNIIICGSTEHGTWTVKDKDYLILKYNPSGGLIWSRRYGRNVNGRDEAVAMAVDASKNIYVTGRSYGSIDDDWVTLKLDSNGVTSWFKIYSGGNNTDRPSAIAISPAGNIAVTGRARGLNDDDFHTIQYTPTSGIMFSPGWNGGLGDDHAIAIAIDANNNVYVTGISDRDVSVNVNNDISTIKYNASGILQWQKYWGGSALKNDAPEAITIDATGNIIVVGETDTDPSALTTNDDWVVIKYSAAGDSLFSQTFNGTANTDDQAHTVAADASGNCIVAGRIINTSSQRDAVAMKLDASLVTLNTSTYNGEGDYNESAQAMTYDQTGNTYVAGYSFTEDHNKDMFISKIDATGNTSVVKTFNGTKSDDDEFNAVAFNGNNFIYACGYTKVTAQKSNFITAKLDLNLDTLWTQTYNYINQSDKAVSLFQDATGNVYVTGRSDANANDTIDGNDIVTICYNSSGVQQWLQRYNGAANLNDEPVKIIGDNFAHVLIAGKSANATDDDIVLLAYDQSTGNPVAGFPALFNSGATINDRATDLAVDATGNIIVSGYTKGISPAGDFALLNYNSGGSLQWSKFYDGVATQQDKSSALCIDATGNIVVTGQTDVDADPLITNYNYLTIKYDNTGNTPWSTPPQYDGAAGGDDVPVAVATDAYNNIYVTGQSAEGTSLAKNKDIMTRIYSADGLPAAYGDYDGTGAEDAANALLLNSSSLFVTGFSGGSGNAQKDVITLSYDITSVGVHQSSSDNFSSAIFPNPFSSSATIRINNSFSSAKNLSLHVNDVMGNEVFEKENVHAPFICINRNNLSAGVYFYKVADENKTVASGKFLVK